MVAWIVSREPLLRGIAGTLVLVRRWKLCTVPMPAVPEEPLSQAIRERIRRRRSYEHGGMVAEIDLLEAQECGTTARNSVASHN